jgi:GNAT superfamily N-acetyltransferase
MQDSKIRLATEADIPEMVILGEHFVTSTSLQGISNYSKNYAASNLRMMIRAKAAFVIVLEVDGKVVGFCGGRFSKTVFSNTHILGQEDFMWVEPDYRKGWGAKLIEAMENEAKANGCSYWSMVCLEDSRPAALSRLYKSLGYRLVEYRYIKSLM